MMSTTTTQKNTHAPAIDYAANLAFFLLEETGSVLGCWAGKLSAARQRELMGRFLGKGTIIIDGARETVCNRVKVCFGLDYDDRKVTSFAKLAGFCDEAPASPAYHSSLIAALDIAQEMAADSVKRARSGRRFYMAGQRNLPPGGTI